MAFSAGCTGMIAEPPKSSDTCGEAISTFPNVLHLRKKRRQKKFKSNLWRLESARTIMRQIYIYLAALMLAISSCERSNPEPDTDEPTNTSGNGTNTSSGGSGSTTQTGGGNTLVIDGVTVPDSLKRYFVYLPGTKNFNVDSLMAGYAAVIRRAGGFNRSQIPDKLHYFIENGGANVSPALSFPAALISPLLLLDLNKIKFQPRADRPGEGIFFAAADSKLIPFSPPAGFNGFVWYISPLTPKNCVCFAGPGMSLRYVTITDGNVSFLNSGFVWTITAPPIPWQN